MTGFLSLKPAITLFLLPSLATIFQMVVLKTDGGGSGEECNVEQVSVKCGAPTDLLSFQKHMLGRWVPFGME